jgi:formyltetrahydrofolate-dependent phosphoribosylglycinamide formyltransferase
MFGKLKNKWNVGDGRLALIILTFALGGSLCGYAGRKLLTLTGIEKGVLWVIIYILLIIILWPVAVILVSIFTGQFLFFRNYIRRVSRRMTGKSAVATVNIAIFASGAGSNAEKIIQTLPAFFAADKNIRVKIALIITDNPSAGVIQLAGKNEIPAEMIGLKNKSAKDAADSYMELLKKYHIHFIVLAGYLKMIPATVIKAYPHRIINIHPALLPAYGGVGMYGNRVHEAVIAAGEKKSGISIHRVNEIYDNGEIIFQAECDIAEGETPASLAAKIHALEHRHYPEVIAQTIHSQNPR